ATRGPWLPISAVKIAPERPKEPTMKVLMVLTSHDQLGDTGRKTGFWLEELAAPYYVFKDARAQITLASPKGGRPPLPFAPPHSATASCSKGRLIRCTVPGLTPNCLAMTRTPGLPGVARASRIRFSSAGAIGGRPRRLHEPTYAVQQNYRAV